MLEVKITIDAPALAQAINNLAAALSSAKPQQAVPLPMSQQTDPSLSPLQEPAHTPNNNVDPAADPMSAACPHAQNAAPVPLAQPQQYTIDQIMKAGAVLLDAGRADDLTNLLHSFGVKAVAELKPEQTGAFATALRNLGAQI